MKTLLKTTLAALCLTGLALSTAVTQDTETPEMKKARISEQIRRLQAELAALTQPKVPTLTDAQEADFKARLNAHRDLSKAEEMAFLKSLGLSDALSDKAYQMLRAKGDLLWDQFKERSEARRRGELIPASDREFRQMSVDLEAAVGTENYRKIQYWQATAAERKQTADFMRYLQGRNLPLTEQQEAAIVRAMYRARDGKTTFPLTMSGTSLEDKLAYIDTVKQSLTPVTPVLSADEVALLGQHLKEVAEKPLPKSLLDKIKKPSNPPAPPR